jgi:prevent-host-death family protein
MGAGLELRRVESVGIRRAKVDLSELLRQVESGVRFTILRRHEPVAALVPHEDFLLFLELERREALASALLRGRGIESHDLSTERFIDLLDRYVRLDGAKKGG